jgi:hypothetical protein
VPGWYTFKAHKIDGIIQLFKGEVNNMPSRHCMSDWPLGAQKDIYFGHAKFHKGEYNLEESMKQQEELVKKIFSLTYEGHYRKDLSGLHVLALRHFLPRMQTFLRDFYQRISHIAPDENKPKRLAEKWRKLKFLKKLFNIYRVIE